MASVDEELTGPEITNDPVTVQTVSAAGETDPEAEASVSAKAESSVNESEVRNRLRPLDRIKTGMSMLAGIFRAYPVTLGALVLASLLAAIIFETDDHSMLLTRIACFLAAMAGQAVFLEECFKDKRKIRIAGYILSIPLAVLYSYMTTETIKSHFGIPGEIIEDVIGRFYITYAAGLWLAAIYHMCRRLKYRFEEYCQKTFTSVIKTSIIYGLFAAGIAVIMFIFNELIYDAGMIGGVEIFLAGGIYAPALLFSFAGKKEKSGRFGRICILYALEPMLIIAMAIIYLYMFKIFAASGSPSNSVFSIISFLFLAGVLIWTLALGTDERTNAMYKIAMILPYAFIPCIALQAWSVTLRISQYGYTMSRYFGVALIITEIIYMILYILSKITGRDMVSYILLTGIVICAAAVLIPWTNYEDTIIRSQLKQLEKYTISEDLDRHERNAVRSIYDIFQYDLGSRGMEILKKRYSAEELDIMSRYTYADYEDLTKYVDIEADAKNIDVSNYLTMTRVEGRIADEADSAGHYIDRYYKVDLYCNNELMFTVNISGDIKELVEGYNDETGHTLTGTPVPIEINEYYDLIISRLTVNYNEDDMEIGYFSLNGYMMEKKHFSPLHDEDKESLIF